MSRITRTEKVNIKHNIAGSLVGVGLAFGFIPIFLASIAIKQNLFLIIIDRLDGYWRLTDANRG